MSSSLNSSREFNVIESAQSSLNNNADNLINKNSIDVVEEPERATSY